EQHGEQHELPCSGLFCFIGAAPATAWLPDDVARDGSGFVVTDRDLPRDDGAQWDSLGREPLPLETSMPGVFAVGDVRHGSVKRVAAAVGAGSIAIQYIHEYLGPVDIST